MYRVIIIDDEREISNGFAQFFPWEKLGFQVVGQFIRAQDAIDFLNEQLVDVIISDVRMPGMSGLEMVAELNRLNLRRDAKLLFFSAYDQFTYAQQAIELGADQYILKSTGYNELITLFSKLNETMLREREGNKPIHSDRVIVKILDYVKHNLATATLEDVAANVYLSPSYVSRYFKQLTGRNFMEYMLEQRMNCAGELLEDPQYKIYDISERLGYTNPFNFTRAFKRYYQMTPQQYRQQKLKQNFKSE